MVKTNTIIEPKEGAIKLSSLSKADIDMIENTSSELKEALLDSLKKRGLFFQKYKADYLVEKTQRIYAETKRQTIKMQSIEHMPEVFKIPYDERLPALFVSIWMGCSKDYLCKGCRTLNTCWNKAVDRMRKRAGRKLRKGISDYEFLRGNQHLNDIDNVLRQQLKDIMLTWE